MKLFFGLFEFYAVVIFLLSCCYGVQVPYCLLEHDVFVFTFDCLLFLYILQFIHCNFYIDMQEKKVYETIFTSDQKSINSRKI